MDDVEIDPLSKIPTKKSLRAFGVKRSPTKEKFIIGHLEILSKN